VIEPIGIYMTNEDIFRRENPMAITKLPFGRLGHPSTRALFGAASLSHVSQDEADRTLDVLLCYGVNHIDVAASYGDAELRCAVAETLPRSILHRYQDR
jgi:aryl-alcohol dehydrogenase-like predicted oxidoreductase